VVVVVVFDVPPTAPRDATGENARWSDEDARGNHRGERKKEAEDRNDAMREEEEEEEESPCRERRPSRRTP